MRDTLLLTALAWHVVVTAYWLSRHVFTHWKVIA